MCVSGHFCNTRLFSDSSFSVLCCENFEVMKLAATGYDETNVDIHRFLTLNMEKPMFLNGIVLVIITIVCNNYPKTMIIVGTNVITSNVINWKNVITSRETKIRMCVFLYDVKVNSNHGITLKARMSFFIRPLLFLCNAKVNLNYCV